MLRKCGLEDRIISLDKKSEMSAGRSICWDGVDERLKTERKNSEEWLKEEIG